MIETNLKLSLPYAVAGHLQLTIKNENKKIIFVCSILRAATSQLKLSFLFLPAIIYVVQKKAME